MTGLKKKIAIFTTTRAEFGAFKPLLKQLEQSLQWEALFFVGGAHLAPELGMTIDEVRDSGFPITDTFSYLQPGDATPERLTRDMGVETQELARIFAKYEFDLVCIAGDRFELIPVALTAILFRRLLLHLYGGESTEGVIDEQIRHMLTKSAHLHFTSSESHSDNVRKMGEDSKRVFTTGELVVDNMALVETITKEALYSELQFDVNKPTVILTYHPVTLELGLSIEDQVNNVFEVLNKFDLQVVVSAPNVEVGAQRVLAVIENHVRANKKFKYCESLGAKRFYNLLRNCQAIVGNSSSGLLEAPFFKTPTVNVGDRQKGRVRHESVIDTGYDQASIEFGLKKALDPQFRLKLENMKFKLGDGHAAEKMVKILETISIDETLLKKKLMFP